METKDPKIRTRFPPSPTGWLHVGNVRTALFNYLFSRHHNGALVLRIEDTDKERSRKEFQDDITEQLSWLGLSWDECYRQSERLEIHKTYLRQLLESGKAFYCAHSKEELETEHKRQMEERAIPRHICGQRDEGRESGVIRLRNDTDVTLSFADRIRGDITFDPQLLGDISIARELESPLYNFVVVVDDAEMNITHVIRGEDHIPNTPKQLLIQQALGFSRPIYAHLPLLLGADRSKLSKRHGDTAVRDYRAAGYMPEAIVNFLALLGWNPGTDQELFTLEDLVREFTLEKVQKGGAIFNEEKLAWMNRAYLRSLSIEQLASNLTPFIEQAGKKDLSTDFIKRIAYVEAPRLSRLKDVETNLPFYTETSVYDSTLLRWKGTQDYTEIIGHLKNVRQLLCDIPEADFYDMHHIEAVIMPYATAHSRGNVLWPLRVALCGSEKSPGPFEIIYVIGKTEALQRIDKAIKLLDT
ncbi:MAG: glutamate--tRNA ligase [Candidatus Ryanbacteria bacterium RIFCSPHIGHO2_02_FULL_45_17b]|uniref:Glutamate--tRNA ligase n=1 Tax=Candidatus Ryanbacteria bacterium RIFCSPHIGHO2_01_FULL_45_22 TaxID=1802114 RepID=A0A1G2G1H1_9BACT|nr:MAG: glutamate--tRNA ligase [Candidatus Ryanbacteria bacterium RIFCSPHIGHO2_01_FULL_45_22]OGZ46976.1 MAG: glutamate--tRNA ligase [Candidatus Ryanbacteria bacterium RIFCSPHIGHO2_02_FULL_45_17b]